MFLRERTWIPQAVATGMLVWALFPNQYSYYVILRWVCCGAFAYLAVLAGEQGRVGWAWILGITALIYNPVLRVHLTREIWSAVNVVTIAVAIGSVFVVKSPGWSESSDSEEASAGGDRGGS